MKDGWSRSAVAIVAIAAALVLVGCSNVVNDEPSGTSIVCFGDSLTAGTGAPEGGSYPAQLEHLVGQEVINSGIPGDTTASAMGRLERDVLEHDPRIVMITLGGNDLMQGVPAEEAFDRLESMVLRIQDRGALVVVGGLRPPLQDHGYSAGYRELCDELGCVLVDDMLGGIMGKGELMSDRIHPNEKGYAILAERFHKAIEPYV